MRLKNFLSYKHKHHLSPLHIYQLEIVLLFVFGFFLYTPYEMLIFEYHLDIQTYQWYFFIPWMIIYTLYCLQARAKIQPEEKVNPLKRPIVHWILLGISIIVMQLQPVEDRMTQIIAINYAFIVFSLFLADSYWDFKKYRRFFKRKKNE